MTEPEAPEIVDGLILQPWQPLKCDKIEYEDEEDEILDLLDIKEDIDDNDTNKLFQIKCQFTDQQFGILLTDLINVWYCEQSQSNIKSIQKKLNPAMESNTIKKINKQIQNMLCFSDQIGSDHFKKITFNNVNKTSLIMDISMKIENIIQFKWQLKFIQYGSSNDQATLLKQQLILPLLSIANELSSKLTPKSNKNIVFQHNITDTFLQFNIRSTMADVYKNTMYFLTFSQMGGICMDNNDNNIDDNNIDDNNNKKAKGRKKKRPLNDSMGEDMQSVNKKRRTMNDNDSDDDVVHGLIGREDDLKLNTFNKKELKRREELRQKLEAKKKDSKIQKKKKKKKKKLRI